MQGDTIRVRDIVGDGPGQTNAVRQRLRALAEELPHVANVRPGRGRAESFAWTWPTDQSTSPEQVWALQAARQMLHAFRDGEIGRILSNLVDDHAGRLAVPTGWRDPRDRAFYVSTRLVNPLALDADTVDRLATAITSSKVVEAEYVQFSGAVLRIKLEPWTLLLADEGVYLYARCLDDSERVDHIDTERIYNAARLSRIRVSNEGFTYPLLADYDPRQVFENCFGIFVAPPGVLAQQVILRFAPGWRSYFQFHRVHPTQDEPNELDDGRIEVEMKLHITYDLVRWVRGHGSEVEVVVPEVLSSWVQSGEGGGAYRRLILGE